MDYLQRYASDRFLTDKRLDAMGQAVTHAYVLGLIAQPSHQSLDTISWSGPGQSALILSVDGKDNLFRAICVDLDGETEEVYEGPFEAANEITEVGVDYLMTLVQHWGHDEDTYEP